MIKPLPDAWCVATILGSSLLLWGLIWVMVVVVFSVG